MFNSVYWFICIKRNSFAVFKRFLDLIDAPLQLLGPEDKQMSNPTSADDKIAIFDLVLHLWTMIHPDLPA